MFDRDDTPNDAHCEPNGDTSKGDPLVELDKGDDTSQGDPHVELDSRRDASAAATGAALAHVLARPDTIRQRAQNAATISSAVAAALVIAAVARVGSETAEDWERQTLGLLGLALFAWVLSVAGFVIVVTRGERDKKPKDRSLSRYQNLVNSYERYSNMLRRRLQKAAVLSGAALLLTVGAIVAEVLEEVHSPERDRRLVLTQRAATTVAALCAWDPSGVEPGSRGREPI